LPAPFPVASSLLPSLGPVYSSDLATTPSTQINSRTLLRGLTRHWWRILLVWLAISAPILLAIEWTIKPTYQAMSVLQIEPTKPQIYNQQSGSFSDYRTVSPYLSTQATLITCDRVLKEAVADPLVRDLAWITKSEDPTTDLRNQLLVDVGPDNFLIHISLELPDAKEAAAIVNAVVSAYVKYNSGWEHGQNSQLKKNLKLELERLGKEITAKKGDLKKLYDKGTVESKGSDLNNIGTKSGDETTQPTFSKLAENHVQTMIQAMVRTDLELVEARANLDAVESALKAQEEGREDLAKQIEGELEPRIREEFQKDPEVASLIQDITKTQEHLDHVKAAARQTHEPARRAAEKQLNKLNDDYLVLWQQKYKEISERLQRGTAQSPKTIDDLKIKIETLKKRQKDHRILFAELKKDQQVSTSDTFEASFLTADVNSLMRKQDQVTTKLQQLDFDDMQETYRVVQIDPAEAPKIAINNKKLKYMAAAPIGVLFMLLGLFMLLEVTSGRVADPDSLSTRVRSEVYALPPFLTPREVRRLSAPKANEQIEQFIQRLDHLRFAVCGNPGGQGKGRCVLITSAVGGEGKTTLAAQLALRCGNAGMSTLLIDADLRRSALCSILDVPEGPGLADVLKDEASFDEVVIPVQDATFYLLRAGKEIHDLSRVLESPSFGLLITQLRQLYDLIIIDSPPVLPVPDALILGRWADGAVLAARYDISRFPRVERARRQLDNAGIAILGTVINGMRNTDSYYGRYRYNRRESPQTKSTSTI
jgi:polysaccharide biosynthesis transport protein